MVTLESVRVYRDRAEVLLRAKLKRVYREYGAAHLYQLELGELTQRERSSLTLLLPQVDPLHVAWSDGSSPTSEHNLSAHADQRWSDQGEIEDRSFVRGRETWRALYQELRELRSQLSRVARPQSLSALQRVLKVESKLNKLERQWLRRLGEYGESHIESSVETSEIEASGAESSNLESSDLNSSSLESSDSGLDINHHVRRHSVLNVYIDAASYESVSPPDDHTTSNTRSEFNSNAPEVRGDWLSSGPPHVIDLSPDLSSYRGELNAFDVRYQTGDGHADNRALSIPPLESSPPSERSQSVTRDHLEDSEIDESPSSSLDMWVRLTLDDVRWHPTVSLFINHERGRLTLTAHLESKRLRTLMEASDMSATHREDPVEVEWIDEWLDRPSISMNKAQRSIMSVMSEPLTTRCPLASLVSEANDERGARVHIRSLLLIERSLSELSREQLALQKRANINQHHLNRKALLRASEKAPLHERYSSIDADTSHVESNLAELDHAHSHPREAESEGGERHQLGYFSCAELLRYPPTLAPDQEGALHAQRSARLGIGELADLFLDRVEHWEVSYEGRRALIKPRRERGGLISVELNERSPLMISRIEEGLEIISSATTLRRIGIYDTSKQALLAEHVLPPLGQVRLKMRRERDHAIPTPLELHPSLSADPQKPESALEDA